tara:strand:- start:465 stop:1172 length:708 start_codon:yes stop_codon:yes gene_type:complete
MFDLNLTNNPGLQKFDKNEDKLENNKKNKVKDYKQKKMKNNNSNSSKKKFIIIFFIVIVISIVTLSFRHNFITDSNKINTYNLSLSKVLNLIDQNQKKINLNLINLHKNELSIDFKCDDLETFYNLLDLISFEINDKVKGYNIQNSHILNIRIPWKIKKKSNFNIDFLNEELNDMKMGFKQEIYKDKLIIVSDLSKIINFIKVLIDMNLIYNFKIEIKQIESLPDGLNIFQVVVE